VNVHKHDRDTAYESTYLEDPDRSPKLIVSVGSQRGGDACV
jgi:hypothetical protein